MQYLLEELNRISKIKSDNLTVIEKCEIIYRTTYMLQNFVYWEAIILSKTEIPIDIKDIILNDVSVEVCDLRAWTHATLATQFRNKAINETSIKVSSELFKEIKEMTELVIDEIKKHWYLFWLAFLTTIENYNSMNLLEEISKEIWIWKIPYVVIHQIADHSEWGHADVFWEALDKHIDENETLYKKWVDLAVKMIKFRLWV